MNEHLAREGKQSGAWAAKLIQEIYRDVDRRRDEQFVENVLTMWLDSQTNRRRFLSALDADFMDEDDTALTAQLTGEDIEPGRVDLTFF